MAADTGVLTDDDLLSHVATHIQSLHHEDVKAILLAPDETQHYSLVVNGGLMMDNLYCAEMLLDYRPHWQQLMDDALREVQRRMVDARAAALAAVPGTRGFADGDGDTGSVVSDLHGALLYKPYCHMRISRLPLVPGINMANISSIRASDVGRFVQVRGTVIRTTIVKMLEAQREYECTNSRCKYRFTVTVDVENDNMLELPKMCPSGGGVGTERRCKSDSFRYLEGSSVCKDYQEIKIQEQVQTLTVGSIPRSIVVVLEDDLVDSVKAGDDITVTGVIRRRWSRIARGMRMDLEVLIAANYVAVRNAVASEGVIITDELRDMFAEFWDHFADRPLAGRNVIIASIAPQIYGLFVVKLAVFLTLVGGAGHLDEKSGMRTRGQPHLLLIGDPGCGKSQFLRYAAKLTPRSVHTTGIGSTSAGLTCTAVKDSGEWTLEAGALVLADRGLCCIDEFNSIREHDRSTIHEAMEQQTLSVAKAGLVCKLNARTTILAATNPKGKYDTNASVSVNTAIASPLLSRFDLVLVLLDTVNPRWDRTVSQFILQKACEAPGDREDTDGGGAGIRGTTQDDPTRFGTNGGATGAALPSAASRWPMNRLRAYIAFIKSAFQPKVSEEAELVIREYYQRLRAADSHATARTTLRLLESLIRLSQAHARIMCRHHVILQDAIVAVVATEASMHTSAILGVDSVLHTDFPADPDREYKLQEVVVLRRLGLEHLANQAPPPPPPRSDFRAGGSVMGSQAGRASATAVGSSSLANVDFGSDDDADDLDLDDEDDDDHATGGGERDLYGNPMPSKDPLSWSKSDTAGSNGRGF